MKFLLPYLIRALIAIIVFSIIIIALQNPQIFPGAVLSIFNSKHRDLKTLPFGVESLFVQTSDQQELEAWRLPIKNSNQVAIIFHGNAGDVANFYPYQEYFKELGITSYGFDYRGYGKSTGWPNEKGLYLDAEAIIKYVLDREQVSLKELIIVGNSIGSGPATFIAHKYKVGILLLYAPFESLKAAVKIQPLFGYLHPFLIYEFPVKTLIEQMPDSCLIVVHGTKDKVIPHSQGENVFRVHPIPSRSFFISSERAGHNDIYFWTKVEVQSRLVDCSKSILYEK